MASDNDRLTVYYDGACPSCVRDRRSYERLAGKSAAGVRWFDISNRDQELRSRGIDPRRALTELHVEDGSGAIHAELDAYILLLARVWWLRPLAWLMGLPLVRPWLSEVYRRGVRHRLQQEGRLPK